MLKSCKVMLNSKSGKLKSGLLVLIVVSLCISLGRGFCGAGEKEKLSPYFKVSSDGSFFIDNTPFAICHWGTEWANIVKQNSGSITKTGQWDADNFQLASKFKVTSGELQVNEKLTFSDNDSFTGEWIIASEAIPTRQLTLQAILSVESQLYSPLLVDQQVWSFKAELDSDHWQMSKSTARTVLLSLPNGQLQIDAVNPFKVIFQDDRYFGQANWALHLVFPTDQVSTTTQLQLNFTFRPYPSTPIRLDSVATMAYADDVAADGKGGWSDQGPENDLRNFPFQQRNFSGIEFDIVDPATNNNKSCLVLRSPRQPNLPVEAKLTPTPAPKGRYLYLLHALAWPAKKGEPIGEIACYLDSSEAVEKQVLRFPVLSQIDVGDFWMPSVKTNGQIAWTGENASINVGLYLSRFELTGEPVRELVITTRENSNWLIVGLSLSDHQVDSATVKPVTIQADNNWLPTSEVKAVIPGSILDYSAQLDAPAGKYGFIKVNNEQFEFTDRPGTAVRFYGANVVFWVNFLQSDYADNMAADFAAMGYNMLRLHLFDFDKAMEQHADGTCLKADFQDRLDYLVSTFKKRGIYITLDIFGLRHIELGELASYPDQRIDAKDFKALMFVSTEAMDNYEAFATKFFDHVNPYTGLAWKDEPAIAFISLVNEGTITASATRSEFTRQVYRKVFDKYLIKHGYETDQPLDGAIWRKFLSETYKNWYERSSTFLREKIGLRFPLTDQNYWSAPYLAPLRNNYDYVDNHFYWAHPVFPQRKFNSLPATVRNDSATARYAGGVSSLFAARIFGKPFTVTEWDYVNPNSHNVEGAWLTGAYAGLQGWSGLCRFAYANSPERATKSEQGLFYFDLASDPLRRLSELAGVQFFLQGNVTAAKTVYPYLITPNFVDDPSHLTDYPPIITRLGLLAKTGTLVVSPENISKEIIPAETKAFFFDDKIWQKTELPYPAFVAGGLPENILKTLADANMLPEQTYTAQEDCYISDTGEITLNAKKRSLSVVTALSEGFVLPAEQTGTGQFMQVNNKQTFAAFLIASRDGQQLKNSNRMLILHLTDSKNSGQRFSDSSCNVTEAAGELPILIRRGAAEIIIHRDLTEFSLYPVDFDGSRYAKISFTVADGKTRFMALTDLDSQIIAAYELVLE